jgi:hypothetical protein
MNGAPQSDDPGTCNLSLGGTTAQGEFNKGCVDLRGGGGAPLLGQGATPDRDKLPTAITRYHAMMLHASSAPTHCVLKEGF